MAARKRTRSKSRRKTRRAAVAHRPRRAPLARTRRHHNPHRAYAKHRRHVSRRRYRNPVGEAAGVAVGAVVARLIAGFIPIGGGSPLIVAAKTWAGGWLAQRFLGRLAPSVFGKAELGGKVAAGVVLIDAYVMPTVNQMVGGLVPRPASSNGVQGLAVTPYPIVPGLMPMAAMPAAAARAGVNGMANVPRMR